VAGDEPTVPGGCATDSRGDVVPPAPGWHLLGAFAVLVPTFTCNPDSTIQCGGSCQSSSCQASVNTPGTTTAGTASLDVQITFGPDIFGNSAGYFYLHADQPSAALFTPASLVYSTSSNTVPNGVGIATNNGGLFTGSNVTANVQLTSSGYGIFFTNLISSTFISSVTISSNSADPNQVNITNIIGLGGSPHVFQFEYTPSTTNWQLIEGYGLRVESRTTVWTTFTNRTDTITVQALAGSPVAQTVENLC
jgi:hypothetical protein